MTTKFPERVAFPGIPLERAQKRNVNDLGLVKTAIAEIDKVLKEEIKFKEKKAETGK